MNLSLDYLIGVGLIIGPFIWYWWAVIRTRHWPTTQAQVFEEEDGYSIQYTVDGVLYTQTPDIESNARIGGIKVHKEANVPEHFNVRYNPYDPNDYSVSHAHSKIFTFSMFAIPILMGIAFILGVMA